jgi:hypothetical protein
MDEKMMRLAQGIKRAREVQEKVETGSFVPSQNRHTALPPMIDEGEMQPRRVNQLRNANTSRMNKAILESFEKNPPFDPTAFDPMTQLEEMVQPTTQQKRRPQQMYTEEEYTSQQPLNYQKRNIPQVKTITLTEEGLANLLEETVERTVEKTINKLLEIQRTETNENFQITIGEKVFSGKLTQAKVIKEHK